MVDNREDRMAKHLTLVFGRVILKISPPTLAFALILFWVTWFATQDRNWFMESGMWLTPLVAVIIVGSLAVAYEWFRIAVIGRSVFAPLPPAETGGGEQR